MNSTWFQPNINVCTSEKFQPNLNLISTNVHFCSMLIFDVETTLKLQRCLNFHFQPKINHKSTKNSTHFQRLFNVENWRWNNVISQRCLNFHMQPKFNVDSTLKCNVDSTLNQRWNACWEGFTHFSEHQRFDNNHKCLSVYSTK